MKIGTKKFTKREFEAFSKKLDAALNGNIDKQDIDNLLELLTTLDGQEVKITATRVDIDPDAGIPSHCITLRGRPEKRKAKKDDSMIAVAGQTTFWPRKVRVLKPMVGWKLIEKIVKDIKNILEEAGISVTTFQNVPKKTLKEVEEYQEEPLIL